MRDIIPALRFAVVDERHSSGELYRQAADEIESLRAERDALVNAIALFKPMEIQLEPRAKEIFYANLPNMYRK